MRDKARRIVLILGLVLVLVGADTGTLWMCVLGAVLLVCFFLGCAVRVREVRERYRRICSAAPALEGGEEQAEK